MVHTLRGSGHRTVVAIAIALVACSVHARQELSRQTPLRSELPTFRSGVELVALNVSVVDAKHRFISGLGARDFLVYENGRRRDVAVYAPTTVPLDVGLLLDASASMTSKMRVVTEAANGFISSLRSDDRATLIGVEHRSRRHLPLTDDIGRLQDVLREAQPGGFTALYDALYIAAEEFRRERKRYTEVRRQVLVVLSDGLDTASLIDLDTALAAVRRTDLTVYAISPEPHLVERGVSRQDRATSEAVYMLTALAQDTGGRAFFVDQVEGLARVYTEIAAEIHQQYTLAYEMDDSRPEKTFHQLTVLVSRPDARVRTRRGYYDTRAW